MHNSRLVCHSSGFVVDLNHFVHVQHRLISGSVREMIVPYGYTPELLAHINQDTYQDPRLNMTIIGQNPNSRLQSILEAVANSIDALGGDIGQFGKGVKQILSWLRAPGDSVAVFTKPKTVTASDPAYALRIWVNDTYHYQIQITPISNEFYAAAHHGFAYGTTLELNLTTSIPWNGSSVISQEIISQQLRKRYAYVDGMTIILQRAEQQPEIINRQDKRTVVVGKPLKPLDDNRQIHIQMTAKRIVISDNGKGMNAVLLSRMFVPKHGSKQPLPLNEVHLQVSLKSKNYVFSIFNLFQNFFCLD